MMRGRYRAAAKALLRRCGIEARRYSHEFRLLHDAFYAQRALIGGDAPTVVFDVGGHHGQTALRYVAEMPHATVYTFEPSPESYRHLLAAVRGDRRIRSFEMALSDRSGRRAFNINADQRTNSFLPVFATVPDIGVPMRTEARVEIDATTLDMFCEREHLDQISILKMDVQGFEAPVLAGASRLLEERRVQVVYTEVTFAPIYDGQTSFLELQSLLDRLGYVLFGLYNVQLRNDRPAWCDAIFVPQDPAIRSTKLVG